MGKQVTATSKNAKVPRELVDIGMTSKQYYELKLYIKSVVVPGTDGFECKSLGNSKNKKIYRKWLDNTLKVLGPRFFPEGVNDLVWPEDRDKIFKIIHKVVRVLSIGIRSKYKKGGSGPAHESEDDDEMEMSWDDDLSEVRDAEDTGDTDGQESDTDGQKDDTDGQEDDSDWQEESTDGQENSDDGQEDGTDEQEGDMIPNEGESCAQSEHKEHEKNVMAFMLIADQEPEGGLGDGNDEQEDGMTSSEGESCAESEHEEHEENTMDFMVLLDHESEGGQGDSNDGQEGDTIPNEEEECEQWEYEDEEEEEEEENTMAFMVVIGEAIEDEKENGTDRQTDDPDGQEDDPDGQEDDPDGQEDDMILSEGEACAQSEREEHKENTMGLVVAIGQEREDGQGDATDGQGDVTDGQGGVTDGQEDVTDGQEDVTDGQEDVTNGQEAVTDGQEDDTIPNEGEVCAQREHKEEKGENTMAFPVVIGEESKDGQADDTDGLEDDTDGLEDDTDEQEDGTDDQEGTDREEDDMILSEGEASCAQWENKEDKEENTMAFMVTIGQESEDDDTMEEGPEKWLDAAPIELEDLVGLMKPEGPAYFPDLTDEDFNWS